MRITLIIVLTATSFFTRAQIDLKNPPWNNLPCEKQDTQTEMNICSGRKAQIADSVMNVLYNSILTHLNNDVKNQAKIAKPDEYDKAYLKSLNDRVKYLKDSQVAFMSYVKSIQGYVSEQYSGGTIRPLMINTWGLSLTEERVKVLSNMIEEFRIK